MTTGFKCVSIFALCFCFFLLGISACQEGTANKPEQSTIKDLEAHEDSLALMAAYAGQHKISLSVTPDIETQMIRASSKEDAADDPAIWVHPTAPDKSLIYGSNKRGGLAVYNLDGKEIDYYPIGNINNVDILYDFLLGDSLTTILGCSNRSTQAINLFKVNPIDGKLEDLTTPSMKVDAQAIDDIYGFCFATDQASDRHYVVINGKNGRLQQFEMKAVEGRIELDLSRSIQFDSQTEGMVADTEKGFLYVGEEGRGIWKLSILPEQGNDKQLLLGSDHANSNITYDIEGLSLYKHGEEGVLVASSQGNFSYALFERSGDNRYLNSFKISDIAELDGVEETDGLDIVSDSLSPLFPEGLLVVQDGFNYQGDTLLPQNFKYVSWGKVLRLLERKEEL